MAERDDYLMQRIEARRNDPEFMTRLQASVEQHRPILARLAEYDGSEPATVEELHHRIGQWDDLRTKLRALYDERQADAEAHRDIAIRKRKEGNERGYDTHMRTAVAFRNTAVGVSEALGLIEGFDLDREVEQEMTDG